MFKSAAVTALLLQVSNVACFTPNARVSNSAFNNYDYGYENYDTGKVLSEYLYSNICY